MIEQDVGDLASRVIAQIKTRGWGRSRKGHQISSDSQVYYDLNIYGDDFYELVRWMHEEFGVQTMSGFESFAPSEGTFLFLTIAVRKLLGRPEPRYRRLTVYEIMEIIAEGKWPS